MTERTKQARSSRFYFLKRPNFNLKQLQAQAATSSNNYKENIMSTLNVLNSIDEQLFTDLSAEQSAIVEGGMNLRIIGITCFTAGADSFGDADETYLKVDGKKRWGSTSMNSWSHSSVEYSQSFDSVISIGVFDKDPWYKSDDRCGSVLIPALQTNGETYADVSGSGSSYRIHYQVTA
jgi:hypothetical protein